MLPILVAAAADRQLKWHLDPAGYGWESSPEDRITDVIGDAGDLEAEYVVSRFRLLFGFELGVE